MRKKYNKSETKSNKDILTQKVNAQKCGVNFKKNNKNILSYTIVFCTIIVV